MDETQDEETIRGLWLAVKNPTAYTNPTLFTTMHAQHWIQQVCRTESLAFLEVAQALASAVVVAFEHGRGVAQGGEAIGLSDFWASTHLACRRRRQRLLSGDCCDFCEGDKE